VQASDITIQLEAISGSDDFAARTYDLTQAWLAAGAGIEAVEPVLLFMERHPSLDFGSPGPLVHFVERFNGAAYLDALSASLERTPTAHTAWMLNRVANGAPTREARLALVDLMERTRRNPAASEDAIAALTHFLEHQRTAVRSR
jgi:hypothetical protein